MVIENSEFPAAPEEPARRGLSVRAAALAALLLLLIGVIGGGWAMRHFFPDGQIPMIDRPAQVPTNTSNSDAGALPVAGQARPVLSPLDADGLAARVADLEQRLTRINLEAQSASGNATRAEGLLVAFAVRRALDRGLPLGYLEPQLRLRFADAQPNAVKTILDTAREPVTIEQLRGQLDALEPRLMGGIGEGGQSFWTALTREVRELLVVRPAGSLSTGAQERLDRARRYLTAAQVDKAIAEVEALPGASVAEDWVIEARRYHEARRALDLIETAAILEPRESPPMRTTADEAAATVGAEASAEVAATNP